MLSVKRTFRHASEGTPTIVQALYQWACALGVLGGVLAVGCTSSRQPVAPPEPQPAPSSSRSSPATEGAQATRRSGRSAADAGSAAVLVPSIPEPSAPAAPAPLPEGTTVLHIGDSFAGALGYALNEELATHGVEGVIKYEKSTYIPTWAWKREVDTYLRKYEPDLVVITLGGNELGIANPEQRAENIQRLIQRFDGIPCVWIGIPLWEGANPRLMAVIEQNAAPCRFLDSHALLPDLERAKDKIHPSLAARKRWARTVVEWLRQQRLPDGDKPWALQDGP